MTLSTHTVSLGAGREYAISVGPGASARLAESAAPIGAARGVVITDERVGALHAAGVASRLAASVGSCEVLTFPAGEASKTRETKSLLEDRMLSAGCGRDTLVVALGGGVTGDLAGFVAATYMRGLPWIQMPTSLLAMADASIGGKTGVDHPLGKNLIGAFHQPAAVLSDTDFLETLPPAEFTGGLAEIVKAGVIGDADLFAALERDAAPLRACDPAAVAGPLSAAIRVKASVVSEDEMEAGRRKVLNFGHTVGHAFEVALGYAVRHGEAVARGMAVESRIAVRMGLLSSPEGARLEALLAALGLPGRPPAGPDAAALVAACRTDKKVRAGRLEMALPRSLGSMARPDGRWSVPVSEKVLLEALASFSGGSGPG